MRLVTTVFPVSENKLSDGAYEYVFVTGERDIDTKFFTNSSTLVRVFKKKQKFTFLAPVKVVVDSTDDDTERNVNTRQLRLGVGVNGVTFSANGEDE